MNEFLEKIYFDNTVRSYIVVLAAILFVVFFKKLLSRYLASLIFKLIRNRVRKIDQHQFSSLIVNPLSWFLVITVSLIAIDKLNFPEEWNIDIYHTPLETIAGRIGAAFIIVAFINLAISVINFIAIILKAHIGEVDKAHRQLVTFFRDFSKVICYLIGLMLLLKVVLGVNVGALVGGLGIAGAALALAGKESIENIIASFIIFLDKPFFTGDTVKVLAFSGTVEKIGLRSTRIRTADKTLITVPNKQMVDSVVDNLSLRNSRRAELKLELSAKISGSDLTAYLENVKKLFGRHEVITGNTVLVTDYTKSGITITMEFLTALIPLDDFNKLKEAILVDMLNLVQQSKIELATTQSNLTIVHPSSEEKATSNII